MELTKRQIEIIQGKLCPYCGNKTKYVDSVCIYGTSYGMIYLCGPCDAFVGVHPGSNKALGRLANKELRHWKKTAHSFFDIVWKKKLLSRSGAYAWLSDKLKIPKKYCHIGMFSVETCKKVVEISREKLKENKINYPY